MNSHASGCPCRDCWPLGAVPAAFAIEPIPSTPGWRGFVVVGGGYADLKSNTVAGNNLIDIGQPPSARWHERPRSDDTVHPVVTGEINYTFGGGWQAFFGTSLEDAVTLDGVTQLGARKDMGSAGILQGGLLFSGIPTQAWEDPYAEGVRREETDRDSTGVRAQWDRILGTALRAHGLLSRHLDRHRAQRRGRHERRLRRGLPGPAAARRRPVQLRRVVPVSAGRGRTPPRAAADPLHDRRPRRRGDEQRRLPAAAELRLPRPGLQRGQQHRLWQQQFRRPQSDLRRPDRHGRLSSSTRRCSTACRSRAAAGRRSAACCGARATRTSRSTTTRSS